VLQGQTFSVIKGTPTERWLNDRLNTFQITANIVQVDGYEAGIRGVLDGSSNVFFGQRPVLLDSVKRSPLEGDLVVIDRYFTRELVALALARDDDDFRLAVDQSLTHLFDSGDFRGLYAKWFGEPDQTALTFFQFSSLTE
jgi:ABC-type amino acid transport substrate-binding protein